MSLELLGSYFGSDKSKRSLQRTEQAFRIAGEVKRVVGDIEVRVVIRDKSVLIEAPNAATAQRLILHRAEVERIVGTIRGGSGRITFRVRRTG